ncbi:Calx-beta domain-containing protein [Chitinophaga sp. 30R24]
MKLMKQGMLRRIYPQLLRAVYLVLSFFFINTGVHVQAQALVTINPGGGQTVGDGLKIQINANGTYQVFRKGKTETGFEYPGDPSDPYNPPDSATLGIQTRVGLESRSASHISTGDNPLAIRFSEASPVMGSGSPADPFRVSLIGTISYMDLGINYPTTVLTTITYVLPNNYFTVDYTIYNNHFNTYFHLYIDEYLVMQDKLPVNGGPIDGNNEWTNSYKVPMASNTPNIVGFTRGTDKVSTYPDATKGPLSHTYQAYDKFASFAAKQSWDRTSIYMGELPNTFDASGSDPSSKGLGVHLVLGDKMGSQAIGTRMAVTYEDTQTPTVVTLNGTPLSSGTTPVNISFEKDTASGAEGNTGDLNFPNLNITFNAAATVNTPLYVKMALVDPVPGEQHVAVRNTDYTFVEGFMIPPGTYPAGSKLPLKNILIIGNNNLEYSRHMTFKLVPVAANQLVNISGQTTCTYTIQDDEPKNITLSTPAKILEGTTEVARVTLPPGVYATERTQVKLSVEDGSKAVSTDFTFDEELWIEKDSNGVNIPIKAIKDSILENDEEVKFRADALVMGQAQTSSGSFLIEDATRKDPTLTVLTFVTNDLAPLPEPYTNGATISLPKDVTTDIPIHITITKSGTATEGADKDYEMDGTVVIPQGGSQAPITFNIFDDKRIEGAENVVVSLTATDGIAGTDYTSSAPTFVIDIADAQLPMTEPVVLHISTPTIEEDATTPPQVWASLPDGFTTQIPIHVTFTSGESSTAPANSYSFPLNSVTIPADGLNSDKINISGFTNFIFEDTRNLVLLGSSSDNGILVKDSVALTVIDKTDVSKKQLTAEALTSPLTEGEGTVFKISLPAGYSSAKDITIDLTVDATNTTAASSDYTYISSITLDHGNTSQTTSSDVVTTLPDQVIEKDEQLAFSAQAVGYTVTGVTLIINDATRRNSDNTKVTFTAPFTEMPEGSNQTIGYSLPSGITTAIPITVHLSDITGSAIRNKDYYLPADTSFTGTGGSAALNVYTDNLVEDVEDIHITPTVSDELGTTYTIQPPVTIDLGIKDAQYPFPDGDSIILTNSGPVNEGDHATITATFPNGWKAGKAWNIVLSKDIAASTIGAAGHDPLPGTITINANAISGTSALFNIEPNQVFDDGGFIKVDGNSGNSNMPASSTLLYVNDATDFAKKQLTLLPVNPAVAEGHSTAFTISLPSGYSSAKDIAVQLTTGEGTEAAIGDYTLVPAITLDHGKETQTTTIDVVTAQPDQVIEKDKALVVSGNATGYTVNDVTLQLNDATRRNSNNTKLTFTAPSAPMPEGSGQTIGYSLPSGITTEIPITVHLSDVTGLAIRNKDYYLPADTSFIGTGGSASLGVYTDNLVEDVEDIHITPTVSDELGTTYTVQSSATIDLSIKDAQYPFPAGDSIILSSIPDSIYEGSSATITATFPHNWKAGKDWVITLAKNTANSTVADTRHTALPGTVTILHDQPSGLSAPVTAYTNNILDDEGAMIVDGNNGDHNMPATSASIYIKDLTEKQTGARVITLTPDATLVPEGNKVIVTVATPYASTKDITVQLAVDPAHSTAKEGEDYTLSVNSFVLQQGKTSATFELLQTLVDKVLENEETLALNATVNGHTVNNLQLVIQDLTRTDHNNLALNVNVFESPLAEGDSGVVTFSLPAGVTAEVPITILLPQTSGTAEAGLDYVLDNSVTLTDGNSTTARLKVNHDNFTEGPETFTISATATDGISNFDVQVPVQTIQDDPSQYPLPAAILLRPSLAVLDEGGAGTTLDAQLPANLQAGRDIMILVDRDNVLSTAMASDHNALPSPYQIVIRKGQNTGNNTFELKALKDLILEDDETVVLKGMITDPVFNTATIQDTIITIQDRTHDDPATGFIHLTAVTTGTHVLEGNNYTMKVSLAPGVTASKDIQVALDIDSSSIANAADITGLPANVTLAAGQPDVNFTFTAATDFILEKPELLQINATPQNYLGMKGDQLAVTIDDATRLNPNNLKLEVRIDSSLIHEGSVSNVTVGFVNDQIISDEDIVVNITPNAVSTADAADYNGMPAQITLLAGEHNKVYPLQIIDDNVLEGDEQLQFTVQLGTTGYTISQPGVILIPEAGDMRVVLQKAADAAEPATNGVYTLLLPGNATAAADVKVVFYVSSITGTTNIAPITTAATILAGQNSVSVPVNVIDNKVIEGDEQVRVALMLAQMKRFNKNIALDVNDLDTVVLTVHDDESDTDGRSMVIEKISDASEPAVDGSFRVHFADAQLSAVKDVKVAYTVGGTAIADARYKKLGGTVLIPAGANGANIVVTPIDNNIVEGDENVQLQLQTVSSTIAGVTWPLATNASAEVLIHDNDTLVVELFTNTSTVAEGSAIQFTLTSSVTAVHDVPVRIQVTQDAARTFTAGEGTVNGNIVTINMPAGTSQHTFTITATDNDINDDDGFLKAVILPYLSGGPSSLIYKSGAIDTALAIITDNDPLTLSFITDKFSVKEGDTGENTPLRFNVQFSRQSSRPVTIDYDFEEATEGVSFPFMDFKATPGIDFDNTIKQVVIPPFTTIGQISVNIIGDTIVEQNETFILKLNTATVPSGQHPPMIGDPAKATGMILNDDPMCSTCDTDGDGLTDGEEDINKNGDPFDDDTDGDGIPNFLDLDADGDGVPDAVERFSTDHRYINNNSGKIRVHPAISPNNDGQGNDAMYIENIEKYTDNEVVIFNRWGGAIYRMKRYDNKSNNFRGKANVGGSTGNDVPDGSYFYNIDVVIDGKKERYTGFIVIKR